MQMMTLARWSSTVQTAILETIHLWFPSEE